MGEELKTDVGSAEERDQATEHRQQEIQEATVQIGEAAVAVTHAAIQLSRTQMVPSVVCTVHKAFKLYIQYRGV